MSRITESMIHCRPVNKQRAREVRNGHTVSPVVTILHIEGEIAQMSRITESTIHCRPVNKQRAREVRDPITYSMMTTLPANHAHTVSKIVRGEFLFRGFNFRGLQVNRENWIP